VARNSVSTDQVLGEGGGIEVVIGNLYWEVEPFDDGETVIDVDRQRRRE
jgi:hypothetical protein